MNPLRHTSIVSRGVADQFARDWITAWNAHDLDRIVSHYRDDVLFMSPFAARPGAHDGVLRGLPALRDYFERALALYTDLHFEPIAALSGVNSLALHYRSVEGREAIEVMELDARRQVHRAAAHYTAAPNEEDAMTSATQMFGGARRRAETRPTTPAIISPSHRPWLSTQPLKTKPQVRRLPDGTRAAYP